MAGIRRPASFGKPVDRHAGVHGLRLLHNIHAVADVEAVVAGQIDRKGITDTAWAADVPAHCGEVVQVEAVEEVDVGGRFGAIDHDSRDWMTKP